MNKQKYLKDFFSPRLNQRHSLGIVPTLPFGEKIPKIIHQTYHTKTLPPEIQENIIKLTTLNPDWEYRIYDDNDIVQFIKANYGHQILKCFNRINPLYGAARADLFRYLLIYRCGGVYLDIKSSMTRPLNDVLRIDDRYLLSNWRNKKGEQFENWGLHPQICHIEDGEFQQWHIVSTAGHPFLKAVIENVLANIDCYNPALHGIGRYGVLATTGPIAYTLAIAPLLNLYNHRFTDSQFDLGFKYSIYSNETHKAIFKSHYVHLNESIVKIGGIKMVYAGIIVVIKKAKKAGAEMGKNINQFLKLVRSLYP